MARRKSNKSKAKSGQVVTYVQLPPAPSRPRNRPPRARRGGNPGSASNMQSSGYARLLADPCHAPLVHPPFSGGDTGYLTRVESDFMVFNGANGANLETGGTVVFTPGAFTAQVGTTCSLAKATPTCDSANPDVSGLFANSLLATSQPGYNFLGTQASTVRPVAACVEVFYPGTEQARQGFVSLGNISAEIYNYGVSTGIVPSKVRTLVETTERTPENKLSCNWLPRAGDELSTACDTANAAGDISRRGSIILSASGLYPGVGLRVRYVVVYEWTPEIGTSMVSPSTLDIRPRSGPTLEYILAKAAQAGAFIARLAQVGGPIMRDFYGRTTPRGRNMMRLEL